MTCACDIPPGGYFVVFHCWIDPNMSVDATHDEVDALERALARRVSRK